MTTNTRLLKNTANYRKTPKGVLTNIYSKQKERSRKKGFPMPDYSLQWLHDNYLNNTKYKRLFLEWVKSGYNKWKKPTIDRINRLKPYTKSNIQLLSWEDNRFKENNERKSRKGKVIMYKDGVEIARFPSQRELVKQTGLIQGLVSEVLSGRRNHHKGYTFKYESEVIGNIHDNFDLMKY